MATNEANVQYEELTTAEAVQRAIYEDREVFLCVPGPKDWHQTFCDDAEVIRDDLLAGYKYRAVIATPPPPPATKGWDADLARIGELIRTQDNRITDAPIFIVEQKRRIYGLEDGYAQSFCWVDDNDSEAVYDAVAKAARDAERAEDGSPPIRWREVGYTDVWEFVTACFTEQGCKDYIALDGHNLKQPRIYAAGSYRNKEWRTVRTALSATQPNPEADA